MKLCSRDLDFYARLYEQLKPSSENIAQSVAELNVKSFLENLLTQASLTTPEGKVVLDLVVPKENLEDELTVLSRKNYQNLTFKELKEKDPEMYYKLMFDLWYIKESGEIKEIMRF
ncbi:hypothetical protein HZA97_10105 [Candidatus Woesearchaeota archaeon]|nr:hypothetical protein [Candidatus Woesearchaeota archaeon]